MKLSFPSLFRLMLLTTLFALAPKAEAIEWPKRFVILERSNSPDGLYRVLIPSREAAVEDGVNPNYLVNIKEHRILGELGGSYSEGGNHRGMSVSWSSDSKWCVIEYDARFGFETISIIEPSTQSFTKTEIGTDISKALNDVIAKQSHGEEKTGEANPHFRLSADRKLRVRALSTTNPKALSDRRSFYALFQGTFDLNSKSWKVTDARAISPEEEIDLESAYSGNESSLSSEEDKAKYLDERMNEVYRAVRVVLPAKRFAEIKQDQHTWLRNRDAEPSIKQRCTMMEARIKALQDLLW